MSLETLNKTVQADPTPIEYIGTLESRPILTIDEPRGVRLMDAPIHVLKSEIDENTTEYHAVFEHQPFQGDSLLNLLLEASPDHSGSIIGVLGDWDLPERQPGSVLLNDHVAALGQHWTDFEVNRHLFIRALANGMEDYVALRDYGRPDTLKVPLLTQEQLEARFSKLWPRVDFYEGRRIYRSEDLPSFVRTIASYIAEDNLVSPRDAARMAEGKTRKITARLYRLQGQRYALRYFNELTEEQKAIAFETYTTTNYLPITLNDEVRYVGNGASLSAAELVSAYERRKPVPLATSTYDVDIAPIVTVKGTKYVVFPNTLREGVRNIGVQPVMSWQTRRDGDEAERVLLMDKHSNEDLGTPKRHVYDSVIGGLLCLAYLSPEIRKKWPRRMRIPGQQNSQELGAAQVPVLAIIRRKQLLDSPLIDAIEQFAA